MSKIDTLTLGEEKVEYFIDLNKDNIKDKIYQKKDSMFIFISKNNNFELSYAGINFIYEQDRFIDTIFVNPKKGNSIIMIMYTQSGQVKDSLIISYNNKNNWKLDSLITYSKKRNDPEFKALQCKHEIGINMNNLSIDRYLEYHSKTEDCKEISLLSFSKNSKWKW